jgi:hypothetical protein
MVTILSVALLAGLIGFAVYVLWAAAIVVLGRSDMRLLPR